MHGLVIKRFDAAMKVRKMVVVQKYYREDSARRAQRLRMLVTKLSLIFSVPLNRVYRFCTEEIIDECVQHGILYFLTRFHSEVLSSCSNLDARMDSVKWAKTIFFSAVPSIYIKNVGRRNSASMYAPFSMFSNSPMVEGGEWYHMLKYYLAFGEYINKLATLGRWTQLAHIALLVEGNIKLSIIYNVYSASEIIDVYDADRPGHTPYSAQRIEAVVTDMADNNMFFDTDNDRLNLMYTGTALSTSNTSHRNRAQGASVHADVDPVIQRQAEIRAQLHNDVQSQYELAHMDDPDA